MIEGCGFEDFVLELEMIRAEVPDSAFVFVEGNTDKKVYSQFLDKESSFIYVRDGKENVLSTINQLNDVLDNIFAIIDLDFDRCNKKDYCSNVLTTDFHDLEVMIVNSHAFERFCNEYSSSISCEQLRQQALEYSSQLGSIRFMSLKEGWNFSFENIKFKKVVPRSSKVLNAENYILQLFENSSCSKCDLKCNEIVNMISSCCDQHSDLDLSVGHELVTIIGLLLRRYGDYSTHVTSGENLERILRLTYSYEDFQSSVLFKRIQEWCSTHNMAILR